MVYCVLFLFVLLIPIRVGVSVYRIDNGVNIQAKLMPIKLRVFFKHIEVEDVLHSLISKKKHKKSSPRIFTVLKKHIKVSKINLKINVGTGDAAQTAIISGSVFSVLAPLCTNLAEEYNLDVNPEFNEKKLNFEGMCILKTNIVHTLIAIFEIVKESIKWKSILSKT